MIRNIAVLLVGILLAGTIGAESEKTAEQEQDSMFAAARTARGIIEAVEVRSRSAIISGYRYDFGPAGGDVKVLMYGSSHGALELLQVGMKVDVVYFELGNGRRVVSVQQLASDAVVIDG